MQNNLRKLVKLHIGCGKVHIPGWKHVDMYDYPHVDILAEAHKIPLENESCSIIYASHVLEYYDWQEAKEIVLPEWKRLLCREGILRIAVPDFDPISKLYQAGLNLDFFIGPLFGRIERKGKTLYHKSVYDEKKLRGLMWNTGFHDIKKYTWQYTDHAIVDDCSKGYIPHMDQRGILLSLNMEGVKI